jgi:hypothetical protein
VPGGRPASGRTPVALCLCTLLSLSQLVFHLKLVCPRIESSCTTLIYTIHAWPIYTYLAIASCGRLTRTVISYHIMSYHIIYLLEDHIDPSQTPRTILFLNSEFSPLYSMRQQCHASCMHELASILSLHVYN